MKEIIDIVVYFGIGWVVGYIVGMFHQNIEKHK